MHCRVSNDIAEQYRAEVDAENVERRKAHAKRLKKHSAELAALAAARDKDRVTSKLRSWRKSRAVALLSLSCVVLATADGMRRLYRGTSPAIPLRPRRIARSPLPSVIWGCPKPHHAGIPLVRLDGVSGGASSE